MVFFLGRGSCFVFFFLCFCWSCVCVSSFRETCSFSNKRKTKREMMSERRIHEEYAKLGPIRCVFLVWYLRLISRLQTVTQACFHNLFVFPKCPSYPEVVTGVFFILMTVLWFTREPGFVPGWTSLFEKWALFWPQLASSLPTSDQAGVSSFK